MVGFDIKYLYGSIEKSATVMDKVLVKKAYNDNSVVTNYLVVHEKTNIADVIDPSEITEITPPVYD